MFYLFCLYQNKDKIVERGQKKFNAEDNEGDVDEVAVQDESSDQNKSESGESQTNQEDSAISVGGCLRCLSLVETVDQVKSELTPEPKSELGTAKLLKFLYTSYEPRFWYWEVRSLLCCCKM